MKITGRVTSGLHQRPEYNMKLSKPELDLAWLPEEVWPEGLDVVGLQADVDPLLSHDFASEKWVVTHGKSRIDLTLGLGEVKAGEHHTPICELELERLTGETADLLALPESLVTELSLRQGSLSKSAQGSRLAQGNAASEVKPLSVLYPPAKATVEQGLEGSLELALFGGIIPRKTSTHVREQLIALETRFSDD